MEKSKKLTWDDKLRSWIIKHAMLIGMILLAVLGLYIRYACWPINLGDLKFLNSPWYETIKNEGIAAVLDPSLQCNYSPINLFLMLLVGKLLPNVDTLIVLKGLFVFFELLLCVSLIALLKYVLVKDEKYNINFFIGYVLIVFNPITIINAACWGQTDAIFAFFSVLAILSYIKGKTNLSLVWFGLALAFKMQAVFLLPLFAVLYFVGPKRINIFSFLIVPAVWLLSSVPMVLVGESPFYILEVYLGQTSIYKTLTFNYPNVYALMGEFVTQRGWIITLFTKTGIVFAIAVIGAMAVYLINQKQKLSNQNILLVASWFIFACVFFLPRMHERYAFVGEVLLIVWIAATHKPYRYLYFVGIVSTILSAYAYYFVKVSFFPLQIGALINTIIFICLTYEVYRECSQKNVGNKEVYHVGK